MSEQSEIIADGSLPATVVVSHVVSSPVKRVWNELMSPEGAETLLGPGAHFGGKGQTWSSNDGRSGVTRSLHPLEQIRFSIRKDDQSHPSMVQIDLAACDGGTKLTVTHTNLSDDIDRADLGQRWQAALQRVDDSLAA